MNSLAVEILLAEDDEVYIALIRRVLRDTKNVNLLCGVRDGEEALAYLHREGRYGNAPRPHIVLLDINMPRKNGFEVLDEMKADRRLNRIPVVMVTTSCSDEDRENAYEKGAHSFICKPLSFDKFTDFTQSILEVVGTSINDTIATRS